MKKKTNMLRQLLAAVVVVAAVYGLSSCEKYSFMPPVINPVDTVYFQAEVQPIFTENCVSCHGAIKPPDLRDGYSWEALTEGGYVTQPGESSELYTKMITGDHISRSSDVDKQTVLIWINQGALNN